MSAGKDFLLFLFSESFYKRGMGDKTDLVMIVKTMPAIFAGDGRIRRGNYYVKKSNKKHLS